MLQNTMKAAVLRRSGRIEKSPLRLLEVSDPEPRGKEVLIRVEACAVCRTDLHIVEGELPARQENLIPGHQVVGEVLGLGPETLRLRIGERVGAAWLYSTCGKCIFCLGGRENLCGSAVFTGYHRNGGYAERMVAPEDFVYSLPPQASSREIAPLLCAGLIGYRALLRSEVPKGGRLGLYGFGASAHLVIQIARYWGCEVYVFTRGERHRRLALDLGAHWVGEASAPPPRKLEASILFAPAGELVPPALESLERGGTLSLAGIHMSAIPALDYERHLFYERNLRSVTAGTRGDGLELLRLAQEIPLRVRTEVFPLQKANEALLKLKQGGMEGSGILEISG